MGEYCTLRTLLDCNLDIFAMSLFILISGFALGFAIARLIQCMREL